MSTPIFVFGSNLAGRHGAGAAKFARLERGAIYGQASGHQGDSYALPTCDANFKGLPLAQIRQHVDNFLEYALTHPELTFEVTRVGCGLAGHKEENIAPMFKDAPSNCLLPEGWR